MAAVETAVLLSKLPPVGDPKNGVAFSLILTVAQYVTVVPGTAGAGLVVFA
jgi:hypothetical protein